MTSLAFRQVDVFGAEPYTGNPVAVILGADGLTDAQMAAISVWTNLSECTFVLEPTTPEADYRVRIFTLSAELPFAGHPTLGTARAWLDAGGRPREARRIVQECGIGLVDVWDDGTRLAFAAPEPLRSGPVSDEDLERFCAVLGTSVDRVVASRWVDNGPGWVGIELASAEEVLALEPDAAGHPGDWFIGVVGPQPEGSETAVEVRAFFTSDGSGLREDPVTGSLNASLGQWLVSSGRVEAPYVAAQGTAMGRRGRVHVTPADEELWIGGATDVCVRGEIEV
ncbi:PhzF family phenazine biosynthesis protein [Demequina mangrovi]|uniref:Phenazine biosynthesis protein PhzF family n=1 Tax=Demequina mangrovi TaxID=1043493 RepID=A0A1H6XGD0_9MICO|nr:PhzF family phenazine biosynthesis protein [Demequina mangrovi]SEJ23920.1 phenazine biosynthesis protein PhzF family [Demequina mangrovi]